MIQEQRQLWGGQESMYDVVVIGAGVIGCAIARQLSRYKVRVAVLEAGADVAMGASRANSAIVHAGYDCEPGSNMARVNVAGNALYDEWCEQLRVPLKRIGSLVLAFSQEDMDQVRRLYDNGVKNGVPGLEILDRAQAMEKQPGISEEVVGALWAPTGAITCPYEMTIACAENAHDNGVEFYFDFHAEKITTLRDAVEVENDKNVLFRSRYVVNAAGLHADEISRLMGDDSFSISGRKGEYMLLDRAASGFVQRVIFQAPSRLGKGVLVSPTVDENAFVGPTAVDDSGKEDTSVTQEGLDFLKATGPALHARRAAEPAHHGLCGHPRHPLDRGLHPGRLPGEPAPHPGGGHLLAGPEQRPGHRAGDGGGPAPRRALPARARGFQPHPRAREALPHHDGGGAGAGPSPRTRATAASSAGARP